MGDNNESTPDIRVERSMGGSLLGLSKEASIPLAITDDRNSNTLYACWLCNCGCGQFYDECKRERMAAESASGSGRSGGKSWRMNKN